MTADAKLQAFEALMTEVSGALADLVECSQQSRGASEEVSATLVDMLAALRSGDSAERISEAIKGLKIGAASPEVRVENKITVGPTPIENHNHITVERAVAAAAPQSDFEIKNIEYDRLNRITSARIARINK